MCGRPETEAERNASDREKLTKALYRCDRLDKEWCEDAKIIMAAARKHRDSLPMTQKMWRVSHSERGETKTWNIWTTEEQAIDSATHALRCGKSAVSINSFDAPA